MGRPKRAAAGGWIYHILNRAKARTPIFSSPDDFEAFERVLEEAVSRTGIRLLSYCLMGNHWHLVVWPEEDGQLSKFVGWLTLTHTQRWHAHRQSAGLGHLHQGRFRKEPGDTHFQQDSDLRFIAPINTILFLLFLAAPDRRGPWPGLPEWKCLLRMKLRLSM